MNCNHFYELLPEFLDETLDVESVAAIREHLRQCEVCRGALQREEALARAVRQSLRSETATLFLDAGARERIRRAVQAGALAATEAPSFWDWVRAMVRQPAFAVAACVCIAFLALVSNLSREVAGSAAALAPGPRLACVIDVPLTTQIHVFRQQDHAVQDAVVPGAMLARAVFPPTQSKNHYE